jgi:hypothetical protein
MKGFQSGTHAVGADLHDGEDACRDLHAVADRLDAAEK